MSTRKEHFRKAETLVAHAAQNLDKALDNQVGLPTLHDTLAVLSVTVELAKVHAILAADSEYRR